MTDPVPDHTDLAAALRQRVLTATAPWSRCCTRRGTRRTGPCPLTCPTPGWSARSTRATSARVPKMILTNTFGASRLWLAAQGYGELVRETTWLAPARGEAIQSVGRRVRGPGQPGDRQPAPLVHAAAAWRPARAGRGADRGRRGGARLETFGDLEELIEAVTVASERSGLPVIAQATFAVDERTLGGESPREVARASLPVTGDRHQPHARPHAHWPWSGRMQTAHCALGQRAANAGLPRPAAWRWFE